MEEIVERFEDEVWEGHSKESRFGFLTGRVCSN
jgi:hypothetical protein